MTDVGNRAMENVKGEQKGKENVDGPVDWERRIWSCSLTEIEVFIVNTIEL